MPLQPCGVTCRNCEARLQRPSRHVAVALWLMRVSRRVPSELMGDLIEEATSGRSGSWLYMQAIYAVITGTSHGRTDMNRSVHATGRTLASLAAFYALSFAGVQIGKRWLGGWPATEIGLLLAASVAAIIAIRFRAAIAAYVVLGFAAYAASQLVVHLIYGIRACAGSSNTFCSDGSGHDRCRPGRHRGNHDPASTARDSKLTLDTACSSIAHCILTA